MQLVQSVIDQAGVMLANAGTLATVGGILLSQFKEQVQTQIGADKAALEAKLAADRAALDAKLAADKAALDAKLALQEKELRELSDIAKRLETTVRLIC